MPHSHRPTTFVLFALLLTTAAPSPAQIPDKFTNLEVLPKDISKPELMKVMRGFSGALGVRCQHCHFTHDPEDLGQFSFASDEKPAKKIARSMMRLTQQVNAALHAEIGEARPDHLEVGCFTCHHGNSRPETLEQALVPVVEKDGSEAAIARYRELRSEYYGQAAYDFSEWSLVQIAEGLSKDPAQASAARALLNLNLEFYPESASTYARIAETYIAAGDTATAMTHFDKAMQLAPQDPWVKRRVDMIKGPKK
jgi:tetratricopeptide (TPR) repeat protein